MFCQHFSFWTCCGVCSEAVVTNGCVLLSCDCVQIHCSCLDVICSIGNAQARGTPDLDDIVSVATCYGVVSPVDTDDLYHTAECKFTAVRVQDRCKS